MALFLISTTAMLAFLATSHVAHAYPSGAPPGACDTMVPNHGGSAQSGASGYTITVPSMYSCNGSITVALGGSSIFKGFFCQARTGANSNTRLGTFNIGSSMGIKLECNNQAVTHNSDDEKTAVQFYWTPEKDHGNIYIVCSWVQAKPTYWVKETSTVIAFQDDGATCESNSGSHVTSRWYPYAIMAVLAVLVF